MNGFVPLGEETEDGLSLPCDGHLQIRNWVLVRHQIHEQADLGPSDFQNCEKQTLVLSATHATVFVTAPELTTMAIRSFERSGLSPTLQSGPGAPALARRLPLPIQPPVPSLPVGQAQHFSSGGPRLVQAKRALVPTRTASHPSPHGTEQFCSTGRVKSVTSDI